MEQKENPVAALLFYWDPLGRQVRIEGPVSFVPDSEADEYFHMRPKRSQLAAAASQQSQVIDSRASLIRKYDQLDQQFADSETVVRPPDWGGVVVRPESFEFWQGQSSRLHDRIVFRRRKDKESSSRVTTRGTELRGQGNEAGDPGLQATATHASLDDGNDAKDGGDGRVDEWIMERLQP